VNERIGQRAASSHACAGRGCVYVAKVLTGQADRPPTTTDRRAALSSRPCIVCSPLLSCGLAACLCHSVAVGWGAGCVPLCRSVGIGWGLSFRVVSEKQTEAGFAARACVERTFRAQRCAAVLLKLSLRSAAQRTGTKASTPHTSSAP